MALSIFGSLHREHQVIVDANEDLEGLDGTLTAKGGKMTGRKRMNRQGCYFSATFLYLWSLSWYRQSLPCIERASWAIARRIRGTFFPISNCKRLRCAFCTRYMKHHFQLHRMVSVVLVQCLCLSHQVSAVSFAPVAQRSWTRLQYQNAQSLIAVVTSYLCAVHVTFGSFQIQQGAAAKAVSLGVHVVLRHFEVWSLRVSMNYDLWCVQVAKTNCVKCRSVTH